ncbi:MAG: hypothetical protein DI626_00010 [Micavibrio aeruginosavorus]|uniref:Uncharacterized protein n=1 Tax=Micavibrio aeruginosavorus TaxID=349221 RepID=A0A2W5A3D4_9BACT|nr:MAG: hypothetical protein DI626_00010 [Micavibrio aeruginosavorus]
MSLSQIFVQPFYEGADDRLTACLNRMAALVPVQETQAVSPSAVSSAAAAADGIGTNKAFRELASSISSMVHLDGNQNICAKPDIQNKLFNAFEAFNAAIVNDQTVSLTDAGKQHFADCKRSREVYAGMLHGGLGATTYQVNWPAMKIA